ncbi:MAG: allantoicase [Acidimicrobiia bacterium]|nr:allantoicase [Acidimicrobiia bacterium]
MDPALLIDLATAGVGGRVLEASDEFFAPKERLLRVEGPESHPGRYTDRGRWVDGWVTRRRREPGHEWALVRLGYPGIVRRVVLDTTHIVHDAPAGASVEAASFDGDPHIVDLVRSRGRWSDLVPRTEVHPDAVSEFDVDRAEPVTHVRLVVYPDGGVARLRCLGEPVPPAGLLDGERELDLAAVAHGARVVASSAPRGNPNVMLRRSDVREVGDVWETPRRRGAGNDYAVVRLAGRGRITGVTIDTSTITGNLPAAVEVSTVDAPDATEADLASAVWRPLLERTEPDAGRVHTFDDLAGTGPATHVRLDVHPDGAVARFRVHGVSDEPWHEW